MGDPLSIAAGVAGLLSLGLQATECLYKYYTAYRDRDDHLAKTADRLDDLHRTLQIIYDTLQTRKWRPDEQTLLQNIERSITRCGDVINELQDEAKKLGKASVDNFRNITVTAGRRAAYPFRRSTLQRLEEDITDFRDNLSTALQALQLRAHQDIQNDIKEVERIIRNAQAQQLTTSVRQWLRAPDATVDYNAACAKRQAGTGQWLVQSAAFTAWLKQDNSFLWLYGFAGCGKSVLCSTAIQHAFRHARSQAGSAVAFFFFTFNDESKQDTSALLRALLLQLSGQITGLDTELTRLKETYYDSNPPVPILREYLRQAVNRCRHVYLLLDALDESPADTSRADVLLIIDTILGWQLSGLHLLVTSRDLLDIREGLNTETHNIVTLQNNDVDQDIVRYVSYQIEHDRQLKRWGPHCETIKQHLAQRANGVFRWVECQLQPLRQCPKSKYDLEECLKQLPRTLHETYERMLVGIARSCWERAQRILTLLCFSSRPLTVSEVIDAIAVDIQVTERYDPDRKLENADDLLRICPGLIDITPDLLDEDHLLNNNDSPYATSRIDETIKRTQIVRIAHFSVQEYLLSPWIKQGRAARFATSESTGHFQISKTCLIYLCNQDFIDQTLTQNLVEEYSFARFAAEFWHHHYRLVDENSKTELQAWGLALLQTKLRLERWIKLCYEDKPWRPAFFYNKEVNMYASPTYYASCLGLDAILAHILTISTADINAREGGAYRNPLCGASFGGHEKVVQILLDKGADVNAQVGEYGNALCAASYGGHEKVVQILLDKGADVNAQVGVYGNALCAASYGGHEKVVQILLDKGADVNAQVGAHGNALCAAAIFGHEKVVHILLGKGANINIQGELFHNALQATSFGGHEKLVQMLLDKGMDVNVQGGTYGSALQAASLRGREKVAQMLLDKGADVNAQGGTYGNALYGASHFGHEKVVQMLLDRGADVNARGGEYGNALQVASVRGHEKVVQILLKQGATF
ncbi:hypothetical protein GJ744_000851 [Endocarpon pusillum]|uniref:NACHT domain-containing protein n=1 Tax=Endocarpon pusillum TaxID=364733 RepID=A0A8H7E8Q4_9EURO|nr:hypothetical protein GJ744_000851 [Endocarpon pusillum]